MNFPLNICEAVYADPGIEKYRGNSFIEALPPIMSTKDIKQGLTGDIVFNSKDIFEDNNKRTHVVSQILDDFFHPISKHIELESKISIMIRQGYVGRNINDGSLNTHMQNGYERVQTGNLNVWKFEHITSTARSLSVIGCSGCGKTSTLNRILGTYPQAIYHKKHNCTQIVYLKLDCPYDGSLKNLCNHFFRAIDQLLHTDYEKKYALKRHSVETLLALMSQMANVHAVGVLVIDEIQHLSVGRSGGSEKMLNFFVTLVNVIGLPVVLVGTPKAQPIFDKDLRSARRSAGFGALYWNPMTAPVAKTNLKTGKEGLTEWIAFTNQLWKFQWLQKRDEILSDSVRACWYDLSQGVLDIVVKIFVLAQLRAIATKTERITVKLLQKVYDDELKPVHPMLSALRSGDPELIQQYSDLNMPNIDKSLLKLSDAIDQVRSKKEEIKLFSKNSDASRLYNLLVGMSCDSKLVVPLVERAFNDHPDLSIIELMPIILEWYQAQDEPSTSTKEVSNVISKKDWHTLDSDDLRFMQSQSDKKRNVYQLFNESKVIFDSNDWLHNSG